jgi:MFS family permease
VPPHSPTAQRPDPGRAAVDLPDAQSDFALSFAQIGWIALIYQVTASLLQPWVGMFTDKHPNPTCCRPACW